MKSKPIGTLFGVLTLVAIVTIAPHAFAATTQVQMSPGAGADQSCVAAKNCFDPSVVNIAVGDTVTWTNNDKIGHTATSGQPTDNTTGTVWDSSLVKAGGTYSFTFQTAGDYKYFCMVHPWMTGEVIVGGASSRTTGNMAGMSGQSSSMGGMNMENMTMNQKMYVVNTNGTTFQVVVGSNGDLPDNVQFSQDQKSLSFEATSLTSRSLVHYEVTMPTTLLSGNFTVTLGGVQVTALPVANDTSTTIHINVPGSFIKTNNLADSATLTITATQAVPEFPIGATVGILTAFVAVIVVLVRNNKLNIRF